MYHSINEEASFGSGSTEKHSRFAVIAEYVGHAMNFEILTEDTLKFIYHSRVRATTDPALINLCAYCVNADSIGVNTDPDVNPVPPKLTIFSSQTTADGEHSNFLMPFVDPSDFIGKTFLMGSHEDCQQNRAKLVDH